MWIRAKLRTVQSWSGWALATALTACFASDLPTWPVQDSGSSGGESDSATTSGFGHEPGLTSAVGGGTTAGQAGTTAGEAGTEAPPGYSFLDDKDAGDRLPECSQWSQNCPAGEKCMPWATDGGNAWNATKCSPIAPDPAQPGEPCTVEGSPTSGFDDCDVASMCWDVDKETLTGVCVAFCVGGWAHPLCENPNEACVSNSSGMPILCLQACDPLMQDCPEGDGCYGNNKAFLCAPDQSGDEGAFGSPCQYFNECDPGLECFNAEGVPGCAGSQGCCSWHCSLDDPDPPCHPEQDCVPWFPEGKAPPGLEDVGVCFIPS